MNQGEKVLVAMVETITNLPQEKMETFSGHSAERSKLSTPVSPMLQGPAGPQSRESGARRAPSPGGLLPSPPRPERLFPMPWRRHGIPRPADSKIPPCQVSCREVPPGAGRFRNCAPSSRQPTRTTFQFSVCQNGALPPGHGGTRIFSTVP